MNSRERFVKTLMFEKADRIPLLPGQGRESTRARWHQEGLPADIDDGQTILEYAYRQAGGREQLPRSGPDFVVNERMIPQFEEKVIERGPRSQIVQDWKGNICEIGNEYTVEHLRNPIDFVTRRWIKCPVENRKDWQQIQKRYDASDPSRLPENPEKFGETLKDRNWPLEVHFSGPYWQLREWMGFERLSMAFYDDPSLVREMIEFWTAYISQLLRRVLTCVMPDSVHFSEDMAYKGFSMLSPAMCRQFLMPCWKAWGRIVHDAGVPIYGVDSDGFIGELIPLWIESGINNCDPVEVAAGNDINQFRRRFGKQMGYRGGVDKRCIASGGAELENEIERISPVIKDGGYIPGCDHGVPHDVSWRNYVHYVGLLAKQTGWL